jgi:hypothetical protein
VRSLALALLLFLSFGVYQAPRAVASTVGPDWATKVVIYNASNADVACLLTTPTSSAYDGCPASISYIQAIDLTQGNVQLPVTPFQNNSQGWFQVKRGHQVQIVNIAVNPYTRQQNYCLDSINIGFGQLPNRCPDVYQSSGHTLFPNTTPGSTFNNPIIIPLPNGSNALEFSLNLPGTSKGSPAPANEALDVSCVNGANSSLLVQLIPPSGGPYWLTNLGTKGGGLSSGSGTIVNGIATLQNSWVKIPSNPRTPGCDDNCVDPKTGLARPGIYPYGCSICNVFPDPCPPCGLPTTTSKNACYGGHPESQFCSARNGLPANNGCLYNRTPLAQPGAAQPTNGIQRFGGTVQCTYLGPLAPPQTCSK